VLYSCKHIPILYLNSNLIELDTYDIIINNVNTAFTVEIVELISTPCLRLKFEFKAIKPAYVSGFNFSYKLPTYAIYWVLRFRS